MAFVIEMHCQNMVSAYCRFFMGLFGFKTVESHFYDFFFFNYHSQTFWHISRVASISMSVVITWLVSTQTFTSNSFSTHKLVYFLRQMQKKCVKYISQNLPKKKKPKIFHTKHIVIDFNLNHILWDIKMAYVECHFVRLHSMNSCSRRSGDLFRFVVFFFF